MQKLVRKDTANARQCKSNTGADAKAKKAKGTAELKVLLGQVQKLVRKGKAKARPLLKQCRGKYKSKCKRRAKSTAELQALQRLVQKLVREGKANARLVLR